MRIGQLSLAGLVLVGAIGASAQETTTPAVIATPPPQCTRNIVATVDALDQPLMFNRLGTAYPQGMIFALDQDVVPTNGTTKSAGNVNLRPGKRPRPIVLRMNQGDCLTITFNNYLTPSVPNTSFQPQTRAASVHVTGLSVVGTIKSDGSFVGRNETSLVAPGGTATYTVAGDKVGTYLLYSTGSLFGAAGNLGQLMAGLFGAVHVQPPRAEYYRSQVSQTDFALASRPGRTPGPPLVSYDARYPANYPDATRRCLPVLRMLDIPYRVNNGRCEPMAGAKLQLFHSDLTAIITGPGGGPFPATEQGPEFNPIPISPDRRKPWREFTILYHEAANAVQAFREFYQPDQPDDGGFSPADLSEVLVNGADNLAINYGTGAIGAEIVASRFGVGPMANCVDCKFEEFFLSAWAVGDPAMNVDTPANAPVPTAALEQCQAHAAGIPATPKPPLSTCPGWTDLNPTKGPKATKALFPDDPSNVYHSYLNDHVKFHILNAGSVASHIHHQHAHQWLHTPNDPGSSYLDSQLLGPGVGYTLEIGFGGSGNRNHTVGDSIFHCHFYPHFAGGMWAMWRVHDVFESGTVLSPDGTVPPKARALPDGEIATGTPIPAIVPMPTYGMAPVPANVEIVRVCKPQFGVNCSQTDRQQWAGTEARVTSPGNPGYPFFIPGVAGHRPPHPPYDFACEQLPDGKCKTDASGKVVYLDGGLQRHVVLDGEVGYQRLNQWDFTRDNDKLAVRPLPETGTELEKRAIKFFSTYEYASYTPDGTPASYFTNGLPRGPQRGAPYADPAVAEGKAVGEPMRTYKAAVLQMDVVFNKVGWHYPQQRLLALWGDVQPTLKGTRAPEPLFFRANSNDVVEYWHTNLVPSYYELDDFQVRTPTDVIGQHIHLVQFDVTSSDGAANGFNYEDGTFSPDEVRDRIDAIRANNGCPSRDPLVYCPTAKAPPPELGQAPYGQNWLGAQTTIQRWWVDPLEVSGPGQRIKTVFTHDHFGPSTHQQIGLYAGVLVEPHGSSWLDQLTGKPMGGRFDGGPTSWMANIVAPDPKRSFREFALEFGDNSLAYQATSRSSPGPYDPFYKEPLTNVSVPWGWADCVNAINGPLSRPGCNPGGTGSGALQAQPGVITAQQGIGTMTVNYRNEPLPLRVFPSTAPPPNADPNALDLSHVYRSIVRQYPPLNTQPSGPLNPPPAGPFLISLLPSWPVFRYPGGFPGAGATDPYTPLLRAYEGDRVHVRVLVGSNLFQHDFVMQGVRWLFERSAPNSGYRSHQTMGISEHYEFDFHVPVRPASSPNATADYLYAPGAGTLDQIQGLWGIFRAYRNNATVTPGLQRLPNNPASAPPAGDICPSNAKVVTFDITAIDSTALNKYGNNITYNDRMTDAIGIFNGPLLWVRTSELTNGQLTRKPEPLILRANAGDCIQLTLRNNFATSTATFGSANQSTQKMGPSISVNLLTSSTAGLSPQLVSYDVTTSNGANVGMNPVQTVAAQGQAQTYRWYAGIADVGPDGQRRYRPAEFGSTNLMTSDPLMQAQQAMIGALIIEPAGATWAEDAGTRAQAWVTAPGQERFREFVAINQNGANLAWPVSTGDNSTTNSVNYGTEPMWYRYNDSGSGNTNFDAVDVSAAFSNSLSGAPGGKTMGDPKTPIFTAPAGAAVRFRMLHPDGPGGFPDTIWTINGHSWQEEPYTNGSLSLGNNPLSNVQGARDAFGFGGAFDILTRAGGSRAVPGDYLYSSFPAFEFPYGNWGVFRVGPSVPEIQVTGIAVPPSNIPDAAPDLSRFDTKRHPGDTTEPAERKPEEDGGGQQRPRPPGDSSQE